MQYEKKGFSDRRRRFFGFSSKQLAEKVLEMTGSKSDIVYKPLPADDPTQRRPVIDLAIEKLNWKPQIALEEGLKKTIEYFKPLV